MKKSNKIVTITLIVVFVIFFGFFSFFSTTIGDDGEVTPFVFFTSTPTIELDADGWWSSMPTSISVTMPVTPVLTPTLKP